MLECFFVNGTGEFVGEISYECESIYFDESRGCWVCEGLIDGGEVLPHYYVPENFRLMSVYQI